MLDSLTKKQKIVFFLILFIMIIFIIYYIYSSLYKNETTNIISANNIIDNYTLNNNELYSNNSITNNNIIIYICGAVKESKVISLKDGSRISDAIEAVGGLSSEADLSNINLAYILEDGEKIYIPKNGEELEDTSSTSQNNTENYTTSSKSKKININKATQTELEIIPGIGPSTALKILEYREKNGNFKDIQDIKKISGIGDAKYENLKEYITVK